ncbi:MAG: pre-16S rRNA-processing nuclease YqgF, partial [Rhodobacteraceae bacterium]|nr:pre-16S rRNA-processing nuclease YqgF [Paracoccaceae bacterium]
MHIGFRRDDFARYQAIIEEYGVTLVLMGLPLSLDGSDSAMTSWVRDYSAECATVISTPLQLWDETFTTRQA